MCRHAHRYLHKKQPGGYSWSPWVVHLLNHRKALTPSVFVCVCVFQELTEEGIPFLILFHVKEDAESLEKFQHEVARQLISEKGEFVCLWHFVPVGDVNFSSR